MTDNLGTFRHTKSFIKLYFMTTSCYILKSSFDVLHEKSLKCNFSLERLKLFFWQNNRQFSENKNSPTKRETAISIYA